MTQAQLADACGLTDSAIRNYELGNRMPGEGQVSAIAAALSVSPEALKEVRIDSARQALELLFRLSDEFGLAPERVDGEIVLKLEKGAKGAPKLNAALEAWMGVVERQEAGELTAAEVEEWRASLGS